MQVHLAHCHQPLGGHLDARDLGVVMDGLDKAIRVVAGQIEVGSR